MRHRELTLKLAAIAASMFVFGFALVPLYDVFCAVTGFGGKTAAAAADVRENVDAARAVRVEFVASLDPAAPFEFRPNVSSMTVHPGEIMETSFHARNRTSRHLTAHAVPSVAPGSAARHFKKIECFCFTEQAFEPNEGRDMGVRFAIDPGLPAYVDTVTLSYTFYRTQ